MNLETQVFGLAGLYQAVPLALELARDGRCDKAAEAACLQSLLRIDADSAAAVYGGASSMHRGLQALIAELERPRDLVVTRTVATVANLERKLHHRPDLQAQILAGIRALQPPSGQPEGDEEPAVERLAELYAATISTLSPRIMVAGNGIYLAQTAIVARIRALLLAAIRAAVLWRQGGGSGLRLLLHRARIAQVARELLAVRDAPS